MKKIILKITSILTLLLVSLFVIAGPKADAATSIYKIANHFTFSSDMNIDEGFRLIKPFILYEDGQPSMSNFTFNYEYLEDNRYRYYGTYPDGSTYSVQSSSSIINDASGTYVEAQMIDPYYRQSIYVKDLKEDKTVNDCLMECWRNKWVNIEYPDYSVYDKPTQNIYPKTTSFSNAAGSHHLIYYAIIENVNYTPPTQDTETELPGNDSNDPTLDNPIIPDEGGNTGNQPTDTPTQDNNNTNNNQNNQNNNPSQGNQNDNTTNEKDPLLIALFCAGGLLGLVVLFLIYKVCKSLIVWLKR